MLIYRLKSVAAKAVTAATDPVPMPMQYPNQPFQNKIVYSSRFTLQTIPYTRATQIFRLMRAPALQKLLCESDLCMDIPVSGFVDNTKTLSHLHVNN